MSDLWLAVHHGDHRAELAVPPQLAVAELAVEAGRLLQATGTLRTLSGAVLSPDRPVGEQAGDGDLLVLATDPLPRPPPRWDDPAEAVAAEVAARPAWASGDSHRLRLALAGASAAVLVVAAALALPPLVVALGVLAVGIVSFALRGPRLLPAVLAPGLVVVATASPWGVAASATALGAALVLVLGLVPATALARAGPLVDVRHLVVAAHLSVGALLTLAAAGSTEPAGACVVGVSSVLLALRGRRHRDRDEALAAAVGGLAPASVLAVVALADPDWRATALAVAAVVGVGAGLARPSLRLTRLLDLAETGLVLALPTLVALWTGLPRALS